MFIIRPTNKKVLGLAVWLLAITALALFTPATVKAATQAEYYVSPGGSDGNPGTFALPFLTIAKARDVIRTINRPLTGDIFVYLRCGTFYLTAPLQFGANDGGGNGFSITYMPYNNETVVISGGEPVTGWTVHSGNIYKATLNRNTKLRGLYVNGKKAAMTEKTAQPTGTSGTFTIAGTESWAQTSGSTFNALTFNSTSLPSYANPDDVEIEWRWQWCDNIACVKNMTTSGTVTTVSMQQPMGAMAAKLRWGWLGYKDEFGAVYNITFRNAFELLTAPGQFYFNKTTKTLYYFSRGENMSTATVIAPLAEGLIQIYGASTTNRVNNLKINGLNFMHDHFLLTDVGGSRGFIGSQSSAVFYKFRADGDHSKASFSNEDLPQATIGLRNCDSILIEKCRFLQLGSAITVNLENDVNNSAVVANVFKDLSGNAVNIAHPQHYAIGDGPKFPAGVEASCKNNLVNNNFIRNTSMEFKREEGITGYHIEGLEVSHNDIQFTPYGSIALGWYWAVSGSIPASTVMRNIKINNNICGNDHALLKDGGTIYFMNSSPNSEVTGNYTINGTWALMPDEGTGLWAIKNNVVNKASDLWLQVWSSTCHDLAIDNNYTNQTSFVNAGARCVITNTHNETAAPPWSAGAQAIINAAGIETAYKSIMSDTLLPEPCPVGIMNRVPLARVNAGLSPVRILGCAVDLPAAFAGRSFSVEVYDLQGRTVCSIPVEKAAQYRSNRKTNLTTGNYLAKCTSGVNSAFVKLFVFQH